jgi:hypothetical protein
MQMNVQAAGNTAETSLPSGLSEPETVRYIKPGVGGQWRQIAFDSGIVPFDCYGIDHALCLSGDWGKAENELARSGIKNTKDALRQLRDFYELPSTAIWFMIADGRLYWTVADPTVNVAALAQPGHPKRWRQTRGGWRSESLTGEPLTVANLSSALTKVAAYRQSICATKEAAYLLRRIRGEADPLFKRADDFRLEQVQVTLDMIRRLQPDEFEIMVELIFGRNGWRRTGGVGGNQADIDVMLEHSVTEETAWVQVKSSCSQSVVDDYCGRFQRNEIASRCFLAVHSPEGQLHRPEVANFHLWNDVRLAERALDAGLFDWLLKRIR